MSTYLYEDVNIHKLQTIFTIYVLLAQKRECYNTIVKTIY